MGTGTYIFKHTHRHTHAERERETDRQTDRQTDRPSELYYTKIQMSDSRLFLQSVSANLPAKRLHINNIDYHGERERERERERVV